MSDDYVPRVTVGTVDISLPRPVDHSPSVVLRDLDAAYAQARSALVREVRTEALTAANEHYRARVEGALPAPLREIADAELQQAIVAEQQAPSQNVDPALRRAEYEGNWTDDPAMRNEGGF
jgi:hypothetical protein